MSANETVPKCQLEDGSRYQYVNVRSASRASSCLPRLAINQLNQLIMNSYFIDEELHLKREQVGGK